MSESGVISSQTFYRPVISQSGHTGIRSVPVIRRPFVWLNVVCLDAPLVAIAWQSLFARTLSVAVPASCRAALFLTAWFIYLIDRFADSISLGADVPKSIRQQFCSDHRKFWLGLMMAVGLLDSIIVFVDLDHVVMMRGLVLGAVAFCYLILNWFFHRVWQTLPIKELIIGFLFAAGTVIVGVPVSLKFATFSGAFATAAVLFALLCSLNCISIATWERSLDKSQSRHSIATRPLDVSYRVRIWLVGVTLVAIVLFVFGGLNHTIAICLTLSTGLLLTLHIVQISRDERTALADLVLLTPLIILFLERTQ